LRSSPKITLPQNEAPATSWQLYTYLCPEQVVTTICCEKFQIFPSSPMDCTTNLLKLNTTNASMKF